MQAGHVRCLFKQQGAPISTDVEMRTRSKRDLVVAAVILLISLTAGSSWIQARKSPKQELSSEEKREAERRLWDLGYWAGPVDGKFDSASRHALIAFQKVERRALTGNLTRNELEALRNGTRPAARHGQYGHVEIDRKRQVLFVIDETGVVFRILPVSTGNGQLYWDKGQIHRATTPTGTFKVYRKINGWRLSSLGLLYYPSYIHGGIAVHGSPSVPARPASHGCIRVPMFAAKELSSLLPAGLEVEIYDGGS